MKNFNAFILVIACLLFLGSCKKITQSSEGLVYEETIKNVKRNEPVSLTFTSINYNKKIEWSITPNEISTVLSSVADNATIVFKKAGNYTITAKANNLYAKYYVTIIDEEFNNFGSKFNFIVPKFYNIKENETVEFEAINEQVGGSIAWSVNPTLNTNLQNNNKKASIMFSSKGVYAITAKQGQNSVTKYIWVEDNSISNEYSAMFILNDKLNVTPSLVNVGGKNILQLKATTSKNYHCNTDKVLCDGLFFGNELNIGFGGVTVAQQPCNNSSLPTSILSFTNITNSGTYKLSMSYQNQNFEGTVTLENDGNYSFIWTDNSLINFTKLTTK